MQNAQRRTKSREILQGGASAQAKADLRRLRKAASGNVEKTGQPQGHHPLDDKLPKIQRASSAMESTQNIETQTGAAPPNLAPRAEVNHHTLCSTRAKDRTSQAAPVGNMNTETGITVAVRIRPYTQREVEEWASDQRRGSGASAIPGRQARSPMYNDRSIARQPFGTGHDSPHDHPGSALQQSNKSQHAGTDVLLRSGVFEDHSDRPTPIADVERDGKTLILHDPQKSAGLANIFTFDHIFSSFEPTVELIDQSDQAAQRMPPLAGEEVDLTPRQEEEAEAQQLEVFEHLAIPVVDRVWNGYNACIFAYGQTSSGKTYTMLGSRKHKGLIPRVCHEVLQRMSEAQNGGISEDKRSPRRSKRKGAVNGAVAAVGGGAGSSGVSPSSWSIVLSYMEIYNEQVRDLLKHRPKNAILHYHSRFDKKDVHHHEYQNLKVRQHPVNGPYVEGLTTVAVHSWEECAQLLRQGNAVRAQSATAMNETSSRSHAIFQIVVTHAESLGSRVRGKDIATHRVSKVSLVDLAGSERNQGAKGNGKHVMEVNSINVSLSALRKVIDALVQKKKGKVIPYRESLLTYILSDNLGGNSKTVMCATISPHAANHGETLSTLRYATLARGIINRAKVNEDPSAKVIRELQGRIRELQGECARAPSPGYLCQLQDNLAEYTQALEDMREREEALRLTLEKKSERERVLQQRLEIQLEREVQWHKEAGRQRRAKLKLQVTLQQLALENPEVLSDETLRGVLEYDSDMDVSSNEAADDDKATEKLDGSELRLPSLSNVAMKQQRAVQEGTAETGMCDGNNSRPALRTLRTGTPMSVSPVRLRGRDALSFPAVSLQTKPASQSPAKDVAASVRGPGLNSKGEPLMGRALGTPISLMSMGETRSSESERVPRQGDVMGFPSSKTSDGYSSRGSTGKDDGVANLRDAVSGTASPDLRRSAAQKEDRLSHHEVPTVHYMRTAVIPGRQRRPHQVPSSWVDKQRAGDDDAPPQGRYAGHEGDADSADSFVSAHSEDGETILQTSTHLELVPIEDKMSSHQSHSGDDPPGLPISGSQRDVHGVAEADEAADEISNGRDDELPGRAALAPHKPAKPRSHTGRPTVQHPPVLQENSLSHLRQDDNVSQDPRSPSFSSAHGVGRSRNVPSRPRLSMSRGAEGADDLEGHLEDTSITEVALLPSTPPSLREPVYAQKAVESCDVRDGSVVAPFLDTDLLQQRGSFIQDVPERDEVQRHVGLAGNFGIKPSDGASRAAEKCAQKAKKSSKKTKRR